MMKRGGARWACVLGVLVLAVSGAACRLETADREHDPPGEETLERAAAESLERYAEGLAELADETAGRLEQGELTTAAELFDEYQAGSRAVRETSMAGYEEAFERAAKPAGEFDAARAADGLRSVARGFRSVGE